MKRIKIFLAAYVNYPNAQNINCDNIAMYLDKSKFEVHVMYTNKIVIDKEFYKSRNIRLHKLIAHRFIWYWNKLLSMLLANCDIYYLPKIESPDKMLVKMLKGKRILVSSIEGVVTENTNNTHEIQAYHKSMDSFFAISECIGNSVKKYWGVSIPVLPLGVNKVEDNVLVRDHIESVVWVGNIKANKRPLWLIEVAKEYPQLTFTMIGDGEMQDEVDQLILTYNLPNVRRTGRITNAEVYHHLLNSDLLLMTSEYEGLPKVIQEAAQCGVPSIYINQNYLVDFIKNGVNGYGVESLAEMKNRIQELLDAPERYRNMAVSARNSVKPYCWPELIKEYENYFDSLVVK